MVKSCFWSRHSSDMKGQVTLLSQREDSSQVNHYISAIIFQRNTCGTYMPHINDESLRV